MVALAVAFPINIAADVVVAVVLLGYLVVA